VMPRPSEMIEKAAADIVAGSHVSGLRRAQGDAQAAVAW
jgi:hypothetical protein